MRHEREEMFRKQAAELGRVVKHMRPKLAIGGGPMLSAAQLRGPASATPRQPDERQPPAPLRPTFQHAQAAHGGARRRRPPRRRAREGLAEKPQLAAAARGAVQGASG
jgi:hypothetical protein